ncbi:uncharacterized protein Gasu_49930 [Galdieria sulphuraria]|uniref:FAS1 domain-containing protein n=1 Tax=Galdieria sulphuraria TaxID=130081 RepID=M2WU14_GALSU|nr:uncharacterized protein Gasu_49930 [Galdieria sulphuraria]EME27395.1 hypothetical protein Gasu_49930 [Galdieria sulphuraria]|eukprot:XP_005703915.1 hypothetical protein Gasu_49930 [Galdieria sulphuraria]
MFQRLGKTIILLFVLVNLQLNFVTTLLEEPKQNTQESIADALQAFGLTNFVSLLCKSQLLGLFQGIGDQFTVFAPTNDALPQNCRQLLETNITSLENLLLYQIIPTGGFTTGNLINNIQPARTANFTTLEGSRLPIHLLHNGSLRIGYNNVSILRANIVAFSSVVQITSGLTLPSYLINNKDVLQTCPRTVSS